MSDNLLFEYAVIRVVPQVEREEFLNVGIVLYCRPRFLQVLYNLDEERICSFSGKVDVAELQKYLHAFDEICKGNTAVSPIAKFTVAERFRWLTATRSTVVQTSKVHPGFCKDPATTLQKLYTQLVL
jgi:hypothetical protein